MKKAIKINVELKTITEIIIDDNIESISNEIGNNCRYFCCPYDFPNNDAIYSDDDILMRIKDIKGGFKMADNWNYPIVNNAIILGTDDEGDSVNYKSKIEDIKSKIIYVDKDTCIAWANKVMSTPIEIKF